MMSPDSLSVESESHVWMVDTVMDRGDHVSDDSNIVRMSGGDGISHGKPSIHLSHGVGLGLRLSLTLAVHYIVVVGMRVDSSIGGGDTSYISDSSMDTRSRRNYTVDRVDTSYMMDTRDMSVIHSSYSVPNSSVVDQVGVCFSLSMDGNSAQEDKDYGSHGAMDSRDSPPC